MDAEKYFCDNDNLIMEENFVEKKLIVHIGKQTRFVFHGEGRLKKEISANLIPTDDNIMINTKLIN